jgi:hypothetical protein
MSLRTVSLTDPAEYKFQANSSYKRDWVFIPDPDAATVIASQLTYLHFHSWLFSKLRHTSVNDPTEPSPLVFDVADGFCRTDILLYGAICETALYVVLQDLFNRTKSSAVDELRQCFEKDDLKFTALNKQTFRPASGADPVTIGHAATRTRTLKTAEIKLTNLIKASGKVGMCDDALVEALDDLREDRNTIHLGAHSKRRATKKSPFTIKDVQRAQDTTESLRIALKKFLS